MQAGQLRHRVTWQQPTITNVNGAQVATYSAGSDYWAFVCPLSGREALVAQQLRADVTHAVSMRNVGNIKPKDRLIFQTRILEVSSVIRVDELGNELKIICVEVVQ